MKQLSKLVYLLIIMGLANNIYSQNTTDNKQTTTFKMNGKKIEVNEENGEINVKVYNPQDSTEMKKVYEGIFTDDKEHEKWTVEESLDWGLNFLKRNNKEKKRYFADPHLAGIGWGFCTITDGVRFNDIDGVTIKAEKSNEFVINFAEAGVSLYKNALSLGVGLGMSWKNLHFENNSYLIEVNDVTSFQPAPANMTLKKARLRVFSLNIPLILEWNPRIGNFRSIYVSAGVIGGFNVFTSQKIKYSDANGDGTNRVKGRGLNVTRIYYEFVGRVGFDDFSIFAKYSPMSLFEHRKGPDVQTASIGLMIHI